jgi:hypothetical protein
MTNKEKLATLLNVDFKTVETLFKEGLLDPRGLNKYLLCADYRKLKEDNPDAKNQDLYTDLSIKYGVSESAVYKWVNNYKS